VDASSRLFSGLQELCAKLFAAHTAKSKDCAGSSGVMTLRGLMRRREAVGMRAELVAQLQPLVQPIGTSP
jgi:hypothetical protein